ncbi:flagellar hook-associated protein FlgK [Mobilicoccus sp.]|uniref:flagellar hook-associated protein FlgK n=1 Tax=Mobilicoccus sp. TaxID=2034349 RepID=UPI0028A0983B|nr:flagellar hook-associated protein FlgK [Mobilicoccus sp.]
MVAAFSGLHIGTSAIHAAQRGLNVTGQNIANSATEGYTRQRVNQEAVGGPGVPAFWSRYDGSGEGVRVTSVTRMNDEFLIARANNAGAALGNLAEQQKTMAAVERTVSEPGETGLHKKLTEMWNAMGAAGNSPSVADFSPRAAALERAKEVAAQLNHLSNAMGTQWGDTTVEVGANVTAINKMAEDIAKLNTAIRNNDIARVPSNELLDQRDVLIAKLADLTGATVRRSEMDQGVDFPSQSVDVMIGDKALVYGIRAGSLAVDDPNDGSYPTDGTAPEPVRLTWATGADGDPGAPAAGEEVGLTSGRVQGQLTSLNDIIPTYMSRFDEVAAKLADTVNDQQELGYTVDGEIGSALFVAADGGTTITAGNIRVAAGSVANDLAISRGNPKGDWTDADGTTQPPSLDGNNALAMSRHIGDKAGPDATYNSLVVSIGVQGQSVDRNVKAQENVVRQALDARDNVSGVSLNEEMTNMIQYQHSFAAAAKFISTIDQALDTLINMKR